MTIRHHSLITGSGRAGTTFLVELLTVLGLDTGFDLGSMAKGKDSIANAGLEHDIRDIEAPYIVKSPLFCDHAEEVLARQDICLDHVFVPMRDLFSAAQSRRQVERNNLALLPTWVRLRRKLNPKVVAGGAWGTHSLKIGMQEQAILEKVYQLLLVLSNHQIPVTLIAYPRLVKDSDYLYEKLRPILPRISRDEFNSAFNSTRNLALVSSFQQN